jgi:hypothetical protein
MKTQLSIIFILTLFLFLMPNKVLLGQVKTVKEMKKERKQKLKVLKQKAIRVARKEAKRMEKEEGWRTFAGDLPLEKQLENAWIKENEMRINDDMSESNAYISSLGIGVSKSQSGAKMQAIERAKIEIAGKLNTYVAAITKSNIANTQLSIVDAETVDEIIQSSRSVTSATLKNLESVVVVFRSKIPRKELRNNNKQQLAPGTVEVQVRVYYDLYQAEIQVRNEIVKGLKDKVDATEEELKKMMGLE